MLINYMIEITTVMIKHFLQGVTLNMLFQLYIDFLSKSSLSTKGLNSLIYPVYLKINLINLLLFLLILKIRNHLLFVTSTINLCIKIIPDYIITN